MICEQITPNMDTEFMLTIADKLLYQDKTACKKMRKLKKGTWFHTVS